MNQTKKFSACALLLAVVLCAASCRNVPDSANFSLQTSVYTPAFNFSSGNGKVKKSVSKKAFTEPIECIYNGKKITVEPPQFTGVPVEAVFSYKEWYYFIDGYTFFGVGTDIGSMDIQVDKNGTVVDVNVGRLKIIEHDLSRYIIAPMGQEVDLQPNLKGSIIGNDVAKAQFGEPNHYVQYLYSLDGERISKGYDCIGYFFDGLALIEKDKKVGLIDEQGNEILPPTIAFDTVVYSTKNREFNTCFMTEDAFVLPIGDEFAVIHIQR